VGDTWLGVQEARMAPDTTNTACGRHRRDFGLAKRPPPSQGERQAFTLIELLVVIAVVMLLAALSLSVVSRAIRHAERTNCTSNLHQVYLMTVAYAKDYHRRLPPLDPGKHSLWIADPCIQDIVRAYRFEPKCFYCPANAWSLIESNFKDNQWSLVSGGPKVRFGYIHLSERKAYIGILHGNVELVRKLTGYRNPGLMPYYVDFISPNNLEVSSHLDGGNELTMDGACRWHAELGTEMHYSRNADSMMPYSEFHW
jgi:prepilin-type N-terminal cleavage/methylation domain-containing protein